MNPARLLLPVLLAAAGGCGPVAAARLGVCGQLRKGLDLAEQTVSDCRAVSDALSAAERRAVDDGFDADARAAGVLEPDWVIEARVAYGVAIDHIHAAANDRRAAIDRAMSNLAAARTAVDRLERLDRLQLDLSDLSPEAP